MTRSTPRRKASDTSKPSGTLLNFFQKSGSKSAGGNVKQEQVDETTPSKRGNGDARSMKTDHGTEGDPVVISDDDEPILISSPKFKNVPPQPQISIKNEASIEAGPSRPRKSASPKAQPAAIGGDRHPFPNLPNFTPPPTWPTIVNTADGEDEEDDVLNVDEDGDGSVRMADSDEEDVSEETDEMSHPAKEVTLGEDTDDVTMIEPDPPLQKPSTIARMPAPDADGMDMDMGMEWDEPEDEGMGMEEEGDEEASDIIATPPPIAIKRKRAQLGGKMEECPVCGNSLKGKTNTVSSSRTLLRPHFDR